MSGSNPLRIQPPPGTPEVNNPLAPDWMKNVGAAVADWMQQQHYKSQAMGSEDPATGLPTGAGIKNALQQYTGAMLLGTSAPRGVDPRLFVPALRMKIDGRRTVFQGNMGELHEDVINRVAEAHEEDYYNGTPELGFVNITNGRFHTRDQAAKAIGVTEAGDLLDLQK